MSNYIASPLSIAKIRNITEEFHMNSDGAFPIIHFIEWVLPKTIENFKYIIVLKEEMPDKYAETDVSNDIIFIREDVYCGAIQDNGRDRFTLAHEVGHLLLHKNIQKLPKAVEKLEIYFNTEWQADTFARELLVPYKKIRNMSIKEVAQTYKVSYQVAKIAKSKC